MTSSTALNLELITPEGILISEPVQEVVAMTELGEVGILKNHTNLTSKLQPAPLRYKKSDSSFDVVAVLGGVIEVENNKVIVITDYAEAGKEIDEAEANQAAKKAEAELQTLSPDAKTKNKDLVIAEFKLQRELVRLKTAKLRKQFS